MRSRAVLALLLLAVVPMPAPVLAAAPLTVLHDSASTVPVGAFLADFAPALLAESAPAGEAANGPNVGPDFVPWPVRTPAMSPGQACARAPLRLAGALTMPLALMGSDAYSLAWLKRRHDWLVQQGAAIQVVEVPDEAGFRQVQALAGDLPLLPASAEGLAHSYGLTRYPIVILKNGGLAQ
jgi:integrating conjugative element protein (TIGR03765 family)